MTSVSTETTTTATTIEEKHEKRQNLEEKSDDRAHHLDPAVLLFDSSKLDQVTTYCYSSEIMKLAIASIMVGSAAAWSSLQMKAGE